MAELPAPPSDHTASHADHTLHYLLAGTSLVVGGIILAPYTLPASQDPREANMALQIMSNMQHAGFSKGLAGALNGVIGSVPLIGGTLASGGMGTATAVGVLGIGGVLLGRFIEKKQEGKSAINWGKLIKYGSMLSSALVALPYVLTGISIGVAYMAYAFGDLDLAVSAGKFLSRTLGTVNSAAATSGLSGAFAALPHLVTCGAPMVPALVSIVLGEREKFVSSQMPPASAQKYSDGSILMEIEADKPLAVGQPALVRLRMKHRATGAPLTPDELAVVHTKKLHVFITDSSLRDYHHIHPEPTGEPGVFVSSFTPQTANRYSAWADFTTVRDGQNHKLKADIQPAANRYIPAPSRSNSQVEQGGLHFDWKNLSPLRKGEASVVEVTISDAKGQPVTDLEPLLGAYAHLVGFSADGRSIIHAHPLGAEPANEGDRGGPKLRFHVEPDCEGPMRMYLQVQRDGRIVDAAFDQMAQRDQAVPAIVKAGAHALHGATASASLAR